MSKSVVKQDVASLALDIFNTVFGDVGHLDQVGVGLFGEVLDRLLLLGLELGVALDIDLTENDDQWLSLEEWLDGVEEVDLLRDRIAAGF